MMSAPRSKSRPSQVEVLPSRLARRRGLRGYSLVELSTTVAIVGVLSTLATVSLRERLNEAHSVEAINTLGSVRRGLAAHVESSQGSSELLEIGGRVGGFGGPLGLPGLLGKNDKSKGNGNGNSSSSSGSGSDSSSSGSSASNGNGNGSNKDGGIDGDGNNGHGNNPDGCDPDNPGKGGPQCGGDDDDDDTGGDAGDDGDSGGGDTGGDGGGDDAGDEGGGDDAGDDGDSGGGDAGGGDAGGDSGSDAGESDVLCSSASPVPALFGKVSGKVYQSSPDDWTGASNSAGWKCLSTNVDGAQHYQYGYEVGTPTSGAPTGDLPDGIEDSSRFTAWARGDLDGDGRTSWFVMEGAAVNGQLVTAPGISIVDQNE